MIPVFVWYLFIFFRLLGQNISPVGFSMDYAVFAYDSLRDYVEVYYEIAVLGSKITENCQGTIVLDIDVLNGNNDAVLSRNELKIPLSLSKGRSIRKLGMVKLLLPFGSYKLRGIYDNNWQFEKKDSLVYDMKITHRGNSTASSSDLEIASNIISRYNDKEDLFYKNGMKVVPAPSLVFDKQHPVVYYYMELYDLLKLPDSIAVLKVFLNDYEGMSVYEQEYRKKYSVGSAVEIGAVPINKFATGLYRLSVLMLSTTGDTLADKSVNLLVNNNFHRHKIEVEKPQIDRQLLALYSYPEGMLDLKFAQAAYICNSEERKLYSELQGTESKAEFLIKFWTKKNISKQGYYEEYYKRVDEAERKFTFGLVKGWRSDMGRVYIMYGPPDEIEKHVHGSMHKPYIIWYYRNIEQGVEFDFIDKSGLGNYELVNSNHRDEPHDPDWRNQL